MWPLCLFAFRSLLLAGFTDFATCADYKVVTHASSPLGRQETEGVWLQRIRRQVRSSKSELKITNYHVRSEIVSRYAITTVECSMWNPHSQAKEAIFEVELPGAAFISNFTITINNKVYVAEVKERATAKRIYEEAKKKGRTAGHRETEKFRLAINVEAESQMTFTLTYEELLQRRLGHYEVVLSVRPGQLVSNLTLELSISERTGISFLKVLPLRTTKLLSNTKAIPYDANIPPSTEVQQTTSCAHIRFTPTLKDQKIYSTSTGIAGDFVVQYDVDLKDLIGDVQVIYNGYFVHYFAPRGLPIIPKNVIFLIDVSGSMIGTKIKQTKNAMQTILSDLRPDDHFNIITFSDVVNIWNPNSTIQATPQNVKKAKDFVSKIVADGWTDINAALMMAGSIIKTNTPEERSGKHRIPLVILLTDGEPTIGVTSGEKIAQNTKKALNSTSLFGLAFGDDADFPLLRRLSMENRGVARRIYEDADAALQLSGFYDEVASPLLYDIQLNYLDNHVYDVTQSLFPNYFQGSELVVAGRVQQDVKNLHVTMTGSGLDKNIALANDVAIVNPSNASFGCSGELERIPNFVHRLWAYFTIKELLRVRMNGSDPATQRLLMEKATNLSLKYNFVTPVTSLVIVKPEDNEEKSKQRPQKVTTNTTAFKQEKEISNLTPHDTAKDLDADGDPHFLVHLPKSGQNICFTINGQENDELRLVDDPIKGVSVTGHLKAVHSRVESQDVTPTYFDRITIITETHGAGAWTITITLHNITLNGEASALLRTDKPGTLQRCDLNITVDGALRIWVKVAQNVEFLVLLHHYQHPINHQMDHLGIYISQGGGLSLQAHGLLGKKDTILLLVLEKQAPIKTFISIRL
uniref:Inter-alpha-trypsin inhibitor heavy chain family member 6 n=1 Tax=Erpetoichthys calabaricus TaxID=27687 RepID=A0A8C4TIH9_ERPCA